MNWKLIAQIAVPAVLAAVAGLGVGTQVTSAVKQEPVVVHCDCPKIPACPSLTVDGIKK